MREWIEKREKQKTKTATQEKRTKSQYRQELESKGALVGPRKRVKRNGRERELSIKRNKNNIGGRDRKNRNKERKWKKNGKREGKNKKSKIKGDKASRERKFRKKGRDIDR